MIEIIEQEGIKVAKYNGKIIDFIPNNFILVEKPKKITKYKESDNILGADGKPSIIKYTDLNVPYDMSRGVAVIAKPDFIKDIEIGDRIFFLADKKEYLTKVSHVDTQNDLVGSRDNFIPFFIEGEEFAAIEHRQVLGKVGKAKIDYEKTYFNAEAK